MSVASVPAATGVGLADMEEEEEEAGGPIRKEAGLPRDADFMVRVAACSEDIEILLRPGARLAPMAAIQLARYLQEAATIVWRNRGSQPAWLKQDEAARLIRQGMAEQEVARTLGISFSTVGHWVQMSRERRRRRLAAGPDFERHGKAALKDGK